MIMTTTPKKILFAFTLLLCAYANASSIIPTKPYSFVPGITAAPKVVIPYLPMVSTEAAVHNAFADFKNATKADKKLKIAAVKDYLKATKQARKNGAPTKPSQTVLVILAILLPPLAVYLHQGEINDKFWISLILTILGYLPGIIYSLLVVLDEV